MTDAGGGVNPTKIARSFVAANPALRWCDTAQATSRNLAQRHWRTALVCPSRLCNRGPGIERGMFGHDRVLPPEARSVAEARNTARLLLVKAARRLRRAGYYCRSMFLWVQTYDASHTVTLPSVNDDQALLTALDKLWAKLTADIGPQTKCMRVGVTRRHHSSQPASARFSSE